MGKIFYIMGKSASGKDSIYRMLLQKKRAEFKENHTVHHTACTERGGAGKRVLFCRRRTVPGIAGRRETDRIRAYETVHGVWIYFTADDGQIDLKRSNFLAIGTLESYQKMRDYFGSESICPIYVEVEDGERLMRALIREREQERPRYAEMCRRFLADEEDFSKEKIQKAGIRRRFVNDDSKICLAEIESYIKDMLY